MKLVEILKLTKTMWGAIIKFFGGSTFKGLGLLVVIVFIGYIGFDYSNKINSNRVLKDRISNLQKEIEKSDKEIKELVKVSNQKSDRIKKDSLMYYDNIQIMQKNISTLKAQIKSLEEQKAGLISGTLCRKVKVNIFGKEKITDELIRCTP
jgi:hypothetical protein